MNIAACIIAYNEHEMIQAHLRQYPAWVDKILVLVSKRPWYGQRAETESLMVDMLKNWSDPRVEWIEQSWNTEHGQRNWGLARLYDYDYIITLDPDEFLEDWQALHDAFHPDCHVYAVSSVITYWKDFSHVLSFLDTRKPIIAVQPEVLFFDKRQIDYPMKILGINLHHLSWVKSDESIWQKINNYSHAKDFDLQDWYQEKWLKWTPETEYIFPMNKEPIGAIPKELPQSIKDFFVV